MPNGREAVTLAADPVAGNIFALEVDAGLKFGTDIKIPLFDQY